MSATMKLHPYVIQPEGAERKALLAELHVRHEAMVQAKNSARAEIRIYRRHRQKVRELKAKLRGES
jgi:hypothetical protein